MQNEKEGYVKVTGGKIWYKIYNENSSGVPLVIIHGGPGASYDYLEPLKILSKTRPVIFYDQLGCGNSEKPDDKSLWTVERYVEELQQLCDALKINKKYLLGQSWGASIAVDYALKTNANQLAGLILSGSLISASRWGNDAKKYIDEMPKGIKDIIIKCESTGDYGSEEYQNAMMVFYMKHLCRIEPFPDCINKTFEKMNVDIYNYMWGFSEFSITGTLKNSERSEMLNRLKVPVLFTCGFYDESTPESNKYYQGKTNNSKLYIFQDASHEHHLEKFDEYIQVVKDFII